MFLSSQMFVVLGSPANGILRPDIACLAQNISSEGSKTVPFPISPQTPDMSPVTTPFPLCSLSTQSRQKEDWGKTNYNSLRHLSSQGTRLPGRQLGLLFSCRPGERLPATHAQGLHPEQGVSSPQHPRPWLVCSGTENGAPQGLFQNHLSAYSRKPVGIALSNVITIPVTPSSWRPWAPRWSMGLHTLCHIVLWGEVALPAPPTHTHTHTG